MKERPILFSAPMVRAILDGTKTQTRRVVKPPKGYRWIDFDTQTMVNSGGHKKHISDLFAPYGQPGDRLWVREAWHATMGWDRCKPSEIAQHAPIKFASDDSISNGFDEEDLDDFGHMRPSIFMPHWASRITLEVTGVRVERLQDISEEDARAEGICGENGAFFVRDVAFILGNTAIDAYKQLWESINGAGSWAANPWVWVVGIKKVEGGTA